MDKALFESRNYDITNKFILFVPYSILIPYEVGFYLPGLPLINFPRIVIYSFIVFWSFNENGIQKMINLARSEFMMIILLFTYMVVSFISSLQSADPGLALIGWLNEGYFFVPLFFALGYYYLSEKKIIITFIKALMIIALVSNIFTFLQYLSGNDVTISTLLGTARMSPSYTNILEEREGYLRYHGLFGHSIRMGVYLSSFILLFIISKGYFGKKFFIVVFLTSLACIVLSFSRTPIVMLFIVTLLYLSLARLSGRNLLIAIILLSFVYFFYLFLAGINLSIEQDNGRLIFFSQLITYQNQKGLNFFGIGPTMFKVDKSIYLLKYFTNIDPMSNFIDKFIEIGFLFPVSQILIIIVMSRRLYRKVVFSDSFINDFQKVLFCIIITNIFISIFSISLYSEGQVMIIIWLLTGSYFGITNRRRQLDQSLVI